MRLFLNQSSLRLFLCLWPDGRYTHIRALTAHGARFKTGCAKVTLAGAWPV